MGEVTPYNRIENFLAKGSGADVAPYNRLERILAGEDLEPTNRLEYFAKEAASGGGNPNSVQTIVGTLANPWGDMSADDFIAFGEALHNNNANAIIEMDGTALGMGVANFRDFYLSNSDPTTYWVHINGGTAVTDGVGIVATVSYYNYNNEIALASAIVGSYTCDVGEGTINTQSVFSYASLVPTTLTIIWHPLPT